VAAEKIHAVEAWRIGLVDAVVEDPVAEVAKRIHHRDAESQRNLRGWKTADSSLRSE